LETIIYARLTNSDEQRIEKYFSSPILKASECLLVIAKVGEMKIASGELLS
jgi:hypothetical protein